jgi:uncharacterized protein (TIGR02145 family)/uncharacterized repeat protein (TIGR02543 family)
MKKQILNTIGLAAVAALLCVTCDNGLDRSPTHAGDVDRFLGRINPTDTTGGGTPTTPTMYTLMISVASGGGGTVSPAGTRSYADGATVNVTATATSGYEFTEWTGTGAPTPATTNPVTVTMNADKTLTANFKQSSTPKPTTYTLTIAATSGGTVSPVASTYTYPADTTVRVTATASSGYEFTGWSGTGAPTPATTNPATVTMNASKTLTANFRESGTSNICTITFNINGGSGTTPSTQTVNAGSSTTLPNGSGLTKAGHTFGGWNTQSNGEGTNYTGSYTPTASITLYAKWNAVIIVPEPIVTTFKDTHDGKEYKKVTIGNQTWMAENLNYDDHIMTSDVCYNKDTSNCAKYGRLYDWATAMGGRSSSSSNPSGVQGVCPAGWHLPSDAEWTELTEYVGGASKAGTKLKSSTGWTSSSSVPVGTNEYGFSALPGGYGSSGGSFDYAGNYGFWWSATEDNAYGAWRRDMIYIIEYVNGYGSSKTDLFSVRCVEN